MNKRILVFFLLLLTLIATGIVFAEIPRNAIYKCKEDNRVMYIGISDSLNSNQRYVLLQDYSMNIIRSEKGTIKSSGNEITYSIGNQVYTLRFIDANTIIDSRDGKTYVRE
jgi:hypothetical protein